MTIETGKERVETAHALHESGEYVEAADSYTAAAYEYFGANGLTHSVSVARGLRYLIIGATCLRYRDRLERCQNLCWQGVHISRAISEEALSLPPEPNPYDQSVRGVWYEFEADFRVVGELPEAADAYDRAKAVYADAGDPDTAAFEQFHLAAAILPKVLVYGTDTDPEDLHSVIRPPATLTDWVEFKRQTLPAILERLDDGDEWTFVD